MLGITPVSQNKSIQVEADGWIVNSRYIYTYIDIYSGGQPGIKLKTLRKIKIRVIKMAQVCKGYPKTWIRPPDPPLWKVRNDFDFPTWTVVKIKN